MDPPKFIEYEEREYEVKPLCFGANTLGFQWQGYDRA
jgi:hypothetical protein